MWISKRRTQIQYSHLIILNITKQFFNKSGNKRKTGDYSLILNKKFFVWKLNVTYTITKQKVVLLGLVKMKLKKVLESPIEYGYHTCTVTARNT